jgi:hypothetical protein
LSKEDDRKIFNKNVDKSCTDLKLRYTGRYLNFKSNRPEHVKKGLIQGLHNRASTIRQEQNVFNVISSLRRDLQLNGFPQDFIYSGINSKGSSRPYEEEKSLGSVYVPYVMGVSEEFKRIGSR